MKKSSFLAGVTLLFASLFTTSCKEIMSNLDQPVSSYLTVNAADVTIPLDEGTYQIEASSINSDKPITFKSSNPEVATVDAKGIVTPLVEGETEITVAVEASENYNAGEQKVKIAVKQPLTFETKKDGTIRVQFAGFVPEKPIVYSINKGAKQEINSDTNIDVKKGDKVQFESANETLTAGDGNWGVQIQPQQSCAVYGNVMSMISPDGNYHTQKAITKDYALKGLLCGAGDWELNPTTSIYECKELYTVAHDKYKLTLPATTLTKGCYNYMLAYTGLTEVPELPATEIPDYAYQEMFRDCYELTEAPAIAAESLGEEACLRMFQNCAKLTKAGAITVTKAAGDRAFSNMFNGCAKLTESPAISAGSLGEQACQNMFVSCDKLEKVNAIKVEGAVGESAFAWMFSGNWQTLKEVADISAGSLGAYACSGMFNWCSALKKAPAITVTGAVGNGAFQSMFNYCGELTESPAITAESIGNSACQNMFSGCQKLTKANAIKVKTAGNYAFRNLFANQPELTEAVAVNAETMGEWACNSMFYNCPKLTKVPTSLPAMNLAFGCYQSMFKGCTSLTEAPELPAEKLAQQCYTFMFDGCSKLSKVKCLAKTNESSFSLYRWLYNAGTDESVTTRTFTRSEDNNNWVVTDDDAWNTDQWYVPTGWTITPAITALSAPAVKSARAASAAPSMKLVTPVMEDAPKVNSLSGKSPAQENLPDFIKNHR